MTSAVVGKWGEAKAAEYLRKKRYKLIAANFRSRFGEIDLIAENRKVVVFVEVKLRKNADFAMACEAVTASKQEKIRKTAQYWLMQNETKKELRFDVIEIYAPEGASDKYTINHIEEAF